MKKKLWIYVITFMMVSLIFPMALGNGWGCCRWRRKVTIIRDNYGVPHVFANTKEGLGFGAGYAMAQDRLWQADLYRRQGYGSLAELGLAPVETDLYIRSMGYSKEELREIFDKWEPYDKRAKLKEMMLAYVDGINYYISQALDAYAHGDPSLMPLEYLPGVISSTGLPLEYFTIEDCIAIVVMMAWQFGGCGGAELQYFSALTELQTKHGEELGWEIFNDLFPQNDPGAEVTIPIEEGAYPDVWNINLPCSTCGMPKSISKFYEKYATLKMGQTQLFESLGLPTSFGSNAFVVGSEKSATRNTLQEGGPQMGQSTPQIVLEMGLHGAGIDAVGMMMPHAPTILIGVSRYGAWTSTTGNSDVMDTYIEFLNPSNPTQYLYNGAYVDMEMRIETIYDAEGTPHDFPIYRTIHGPVIGMDFTSDPPLAFTMKTPYYKNELAAEEGWSMFQQSDNIFDFHKACAHVYPSHNFYLADRDGNIGYWHSGQFPVKPETGVGGRLIDDRFPLYGTGEEEWVRVTGPKEMPVSINPKQGWLANWNNKPIANWPYGESDYGWGEGHRVKRIMQLLSTMDDVTIEDMNMVVRDAGYNHIPGMNFLGYLVEAASESIDPIIEAALPYLEAWNFHYNDILDPTWPAPDATYDDPGLTIFDRWFKYIDNEVFDDDLPVGVDGSDSTLIHIFDGENSKLPLNYDYLNGEDRNEVINRVLKTALEELEIELGPDISTWLTPVIKWGSSQLGAVPAQIMHYMNRGTYNQIVEMPRKRWWHWFYNPAPYAFNVIPPGQSGFVHLVDGIPTISPHAYDQLALYETWTYKPMRYDLWDIWRVMESIQILYF
jgi:penicillin amidase